MIKFPFDSKVEVIDSWVDLVNKKAYCVYLLPNIKDSLNESNLRFVESDYNDKAKS